MNKCIDKPHVTIQNMVPVFNSRRVRSSRLYSFLRRSKTAQLTVENVARKTSAVSRVASRARWVVTTTAVLVLVGTYTSCKIWRLAFMSTCTSPNRWKSQFSLLHNVITHLGLSTRKNSQEILDSKSALIFSSHVKLGELITKFHLIFTTTKFFLLFFVVKIKKNCLIKSAGLTCKEKISANLET